MADWTPIYEVGTASVTNNGTTVTGQGTNWLTAGLRVGDQFKAAGLSTTITVINSNTSLTIKAWPGAARTTAAYEILRISDADRLIAANAELAQALVPNLTAFGALAFAANKGIHATGAGALATHDLTPFARTLLDDTTQAAARTTLGLTLLTGSSEVSLIASGTNPTVTYTDRMLQYWKLGQLVLFRVALALNVSAGGAGNVEITGLPFEPITAPSNAMPIGIGLATLVNQPLHADVVTGGKIRLLRSHTLAQAQTTDLITTAGVKYLYLGGTYVTAT